MTIHKIIIFIFISLISSRLLYPEEKIITLMPLGDSITQGNYKHDSYRRVLWKKLKEDGFAVDFVGSTSMNHEGAHPHPDFDLDHEGHWGWRTDQISENINLWAGKYHPDIVLIHLGHNDLFQKRTMKYVIKDLENIIQSLRLFNPKTKVLLARIILTDNTMLNLTIKKFNDRISNLAIKLGTDKSPVIAVPLDHALDPSKDTYDGIHPNRSGELKLAKGWYQKLIPLLD